MLKDEIEKKNKIWKRTKKKSEVTCVISKTHNPCHGSETNVIEDKS